METAVMTDEVWRAIIYNDASYDNAFIYAIQTTGIFCKPSCKSKIPNKENVRVFRNAKEALAANFRPCKRCKPTHARLPDQEWVDQIMTYIGLNYKERLSLQAIADTFHGSPYHLHRTFKRISGITLMEYIQNLRMQKAMDSLVRTDRSIAAVASDVGMSNTPYFITLFKKRTGLTPADYRHIHREKGGGLQ